jgi:hypothetical protein
MVLEQAFIGFVATVTVLFGNSVNLRLPVDATRSIKAEKYLDSLEKVVLLYSGKFP